MRLHPRTKRCQHIHPMVTNTVPKLVRWAPSVPSCLLRSIFSKLSTIRIYYFYNGVTGIKKELFSISLLLKVWLVLEPLLQLAYPTCHTRLPPLSSPKLHPTPEHQEPGLLKPPVFAHPEFYLEHSYLHLYVGNSPYATKHCLSACVILLALTMFCKTVLFNGCIISPCGSALVYFIDPCFGSI